MTLSLLGSTLGFTISTSTTRNRILDEQLNDEAQRIAISLGQSENDVLNGATTLSRDPELIQALRDDTPGSEAPLSMDSRAVLVRDRFRLDQIIVLNASQQKRVNIATYSDLTQIAVQDASELASCSHESQVRFVKAETTSLLVACSPIWAAIDTQRDVIGVVYSVLDIPRTLDRFRRELGLSASIELASDEMLASMNLSSEGDKQGAHSVQGYRIRTLSLTQGGQPVTILLRHSEQQINEIVSSGFTVMLFSSGLTLVLLLAVGFWLAQSFTRPILKLAHVAQSVAAGDLSTRVNFTHHDEIGQLGRAFDQATHTITDLLDQRARKAGELQAILQSMTDGVLAVDVNERIFMVNRAAAAFLKQQPSRLLAQPLSTLVNVDDPVLSIGLQHIVEQLQSELVDPDMAPSEERISLGDRIVRLQSAPALGSGGTLTGAVVLIQDITAAVEADRAKSAFIATASHEMRTPLAGLKGFVDIFYLGGTDNLTENQSMFLATIKRQTDNMVQMVNDLLEMARLEQGSLRTEQRWVSLESSIEESLAVMHPQIDQKHVTLQLDIAPELPLIWIDSMHLRRILTNLISNAVKYVHEQGTIWVRAYELHDPSHLPSSPGDQPWKLKEHHSVVIEIEDNGVGICESDQKKIFTRFFRSENALSVEAGGSGLGLAITRSLVQVHHGQIGFRSEEGKGSCFWVRLPAPNIEALHDGRLPELQTTPYASLIF